MTHDMSISEAIELPIMPAAINLLTCSLMWLLWGLVGILSYCKSHTPQPVNTRIGLSADGVGPLGSVRLSESRNDRILSNLATHFRPLGGLPLFPSTLESTRDAGKALSRCCLVPPSCPPSMLHETSSFFTRL